MSATQDFSFTAAQDSAMHVLAGPQRHTLGVGGSRSGKTFLFVRAIIIRALRAAHSRHVIFRFRYNAVKAAVWLDTLPKVARACFPGLTLIDKKQDGYTVLPNGSEIWFGGLDEKERVEKILGQEYCTVFFNECSQIPYSSALTALTRLAQKTELPNRAYYDLNPTSVKHWTHRLFFDDKDPVSGSSLHNPEEYQSFILNPADNVENLDPAYLDSLDALPERQRKRFMAGEYAADIDGALWPPGRIDETRRVHADLPELSRVVVGIDPSGSSGDITEAADEIGIVVAARGVDGHAYVIEDASGIFSPEAWARRSVGLLDKHHGDRLVAERNFGGEMVRTVIQTADKTAPVKLVTASRGKTVRAEPVSALYELGKVHHVGRFPTLEDQLESFTTSGYCGESSPDRADALVWAITELMLDHATFRVRSFS